MKPITLFSWGYWGWGNSTKQLVKAVDAVEESRGFEPPILVDTRIRRTDRAEGFKGDRFERLFGPSRHRWMKSLGNEAIIKKTNKPIQVADPEAAHELLYRALDAAEQNRWIIFFYWCPFPMNGREVTCRVRLACWTVSALAQPLAGQDRRRMAQAPRADPARHDRPERVAVAHVASVCLPGTRAATWPRRWHPWGLGGGALIE